MFTVKRGVVHLPFTRGSAPAAKLETRMSDAATSSGPETAAVPRSIHMVRTRGDRIFRAIATAGGLSTFVILVLIGTFLLLKAWPAFKFMGARFFTEFQWNPTQ